MELTTVVPLVIAAVAIGIAPGPWLAVTEAPVAAVVAAMTQGASP